MMMKAKLSDEGHTETVLEAAVRRHLERLSEAEKQRKAKKRRLYRLWRTNVLADA